MKFSLDARKTVSENAQLYYDKSKKAAKKIKGAKIALDKTNEKIKALDRTELVEVNVPKKKEPVKKKYWFERFRFFTSSDGFLVVGGKDASTNENLIKKHTSGGDIVYHSQVQGAPFFVVKNPENKLIPESTGRQVAQAAAAYSKAWSQGIGSVDVYYVSPEQVSKDAPSGEYLPKGAFMIYGRKKWERNTPLYVAVGFVIGREGVEVIGGPVEAVKSKTDLFVQLTPGSKKSKELASEIRKKVADKTKKEYRPLIEKISLQEIQCWIPAGKGRIKKR